MSSAGNEGKHEGTVGEEEHAAMPGPSGTFPTVSDGRCSSGLACFVLKDGKCYSHNS